MKPQEILSQLREVKQLIADLQPSLLQTLRDRCQLAPNSPEPREDLAAVERSLAELKEKLAQTIATYTLAAKNPK